MSAAIALHVLSSALWVGGMFFAFVVLRPVTASLLEQPIRLTLWAQVLARFFPWVWVSVVVLLASGYWLIFMIFGGMKAVGLHVHIMNGLGILMVFLFVYVFFAPYRQLKRAVSAEDWSAGGAQLARVRRIVGINTILGVVVICVGAGGRYL